MTGFGWARRCAIGVVLGLGLSGCFPAGDGQLDEKKDPHFLAGKNLVGQMDWQGAIDEFEKALEANPRSASAHFELGWLCEGEKVNDPAAAIYHYEQYLKLSASPDKADLVRQHINTCKLELVKTMSAVGPAPSGAQRELERVVTENKDLQGQITQLQAQLTQLAKTRMPPSATYDPNPGGPVGPTSTPHAATGRPSGESPRIETPRVVARQASEPVSTRVSHPVAVRTHTVKPRETMAAIARQYGISLPALEAANPEIRPSHLQAGQSLKIPAP